MQTGIYDGLSNADYHGGPGISVSGLKLIDERSPLHYFHKQTAAAAIAKEPQKKTFFIGSEFHALLLEPESFVKEYTLAFRQSDVPDAVTDRAQLVAMIERHNKGRLPKLSVGGKKDDLVARIMQANTESGIENNDDVKADLESMSAADLKATIEALNARRPGMLSTSGTIPELAMILRANGEKFRLWAEVQDEWERNNGHRQILTHEQWAQVHAMRDAVLSHAAGRALMTAPGRAERSVYWIDEETGVLCRCRPDWWRLDGITVDVKTTEDASPEGFARSIGRYSYHMQAAFYIDGMTAAINHLVAQNKDAAFPQKLPPAPKDFLFLAVEKAAPYAPAVYALDQAAIEIGRAEYRQLLRIYAECLRTNNWPGYGQKIQNISLPEWQLRNSAHLLAA